MELYLARDWMVAPEARHVFENFIHRRARREPLQHILGTVAFGDVELTVDPRALIPRPETEELVHAIKDYYMANGISPASILDLGTGSGAIILALGKIFPQASLAASDLDYDALSLARANAERCRMEKSVTFSQSDWFQTLQGTWNLIVSNPPYLSNGELESAAPEVRLYEPRHALIAPDDGIGHLKTIIHESSAFLLPGGLLALETGFSQHDYLIHVAGQAGFTIRKKMHDLSGLPRILLLQRNGPWA
jgi:release factor glutamine methyltransferase